MSTRSRLATGGLAAALAATVLATATPAQAATPAPGTVEAVKKAALARIDARLHTLDTLKSVVSGAAALTGTHRATVTGLIASDTSGLTTLRAKVDAETTVGAIWADEHTMVVDYRIYLLVVPKVRWTVADDAEAAAITRARTVHDKLAEAISAAQARGVDVTAAKAALTDLANQLDNATATLAGKADSLLRVAPGPDAAAIVAAVSPVRVATRTARADLGRAVADARRIRELLGA